MPSVWTDGEDSTSQGLHTFMLCRGLGYSGGVGRGVQRSPRPVNDLIGSQPQKTWTATKSVDNPGGGGGG